MVEFTTANEVAEVMLSVEEGIGQLKQDLDDKINQLLEPYETLYAIVYNPALTEQVQIMQRDRKTRVVKK